MNIFLTSALDGGEWSASSPCRFISGENAPSTHWIGGLVAPEQVWPIWGRENSWPSRDSSSDPSVVQPVASRYTYYATPGPCVKVSTELYANNTKLAIQIMYWDIALAEFGYRTCKLWNGWMPCNCGLCTTNTKQSQTLYKTHITSGLLYHSNIKM
jgi:hypothetical protein